MAGEETLTVHDRRAGIRAWSTRNRETLRFCLLFALYATCLIVLSGWIRVSTPLLDGLAAYLAKVISTLVGAVGIASRSAGTLVVHNNQFAIEITYRCTGILHVAFFLSAVLALPYRLMAKVRVMLVGIILILIANLLRIIAVYLVGVFAYPWVHMAHDVAGELFMIAVTVLAWLVGMRLATGQSGRASH